ncbi:hypothetical protein NL676_034691 [Syzygium grande]|nr:hypothetical protein NL676_034691 [Syzygium grande]
MCAKCRELETARRVFDEIADRDLVSWNSMISGHAKMGFAAEGCSDLECFIKSPAMITGYAQNGMADEAIILFSTMREAGIDPDKITLLGMLSSCASIGALDLGNWVDTYVSHSGLRRDVYVGTALIEMYAKCGSLDNALKVFEDIPQKNEASWNAMISALAFHGRAKESLALFDRMLKEDEVVLGSLLGACQKWQNMDICDWVMQLLLEIETLNSGNYVMSSKLCADVKKWDESARMRILMRQRGITKTPGYSWLGIETQLHQFHADLGYHRCCSAVAYLGVPLEKPKNHRGLSESQMEVYMLLRPVVEAIKFHDCKRFRIQMQFRSHGRSGEQEVPNILSPSPTVKKRSRDSRVIGHWPQAMDGQVKG